MADRCVDHLQHLNCALFCGYCGRSVYTPEVRGFQRGASTGAPGMQPDPLHAVGNEGHSLNLEFIEPDPDAPAAVAFAKLHLDGVLAVERVLIHLGAQKSIERRAGFPGKFAVSIPLDEIDWTKKENYPVRAEIVFKPYNCLRPFVYIVSLQNGTPLELSSQDPRVASSSKTAAAAALIFGDGDPRESGAPYRFRLRAPAVPGQPVFPIPLERVDKIRIGNFLFQVEVPVLAVERLEDGSLEFEVSKETLLQCHTYNKRDQKVVALMNGVSLASMPLQLEVRAYPKLDIKSLSVGLHFENQRKKWCSDGATGELSLKSKVWPEHYRLLAEPSGKLAAMARFDARVQSRKKEDTHAGDLKVTVRAKLRPEWLQRMQSHGKLDLRHDSGQMTLSGELEFFLSRDGINPPHIVPVGKITAIVTVDSSDTIDVLGLDFGTTGTATAIQTRDECNPVLLKNDLGDTRATVPTAIYFEPDPAGASIVWEKTQIGGLAEDLFKLNHNTALFWTGLKPRLMDAARQTSIMPFTLFGDVETTYERIAADFLRLYLTRVAASETVDGRWIKKLVFTFPAACPFAYRKVLAETVRAALPHPDMVGEIGIGCDEATAGGLYWLHRNAVQFAGAKPQHLMIYDYGGGTTDISVLRITPIENGFFKVEILGIVGLNECGGEDVTWRMTRELLLRAKELAQDGDAGELREFADDIDKTDDNPNFIASTESRGDWKARDAESHYDMERVKIKMLTGAERFPETTEQESKPLPFEAFGPNASGLLDSDGLKKVRETLCVDLANLTAATTPCGRMGFIGSGNVRRTTRAWLVDFGHKKSPILKEPLEALQLARHLLDATAPGGKVDMLLMIGQAARNRYFEALLREFLAGRFGKLEALRHEDAKTCVATGVCLTGHSGNAIKHVPTLMKRIVWRSNGVGQNSYEVVLKGEVHRNMRVDVDPAWLEKATRGEFFLDSTCRPLAERSSRTDKTPLIKLANGPRATGKAQACSAIVDPHLIGTPDDDNSVPEKLRARCLELMPGNPGKWFFLMWTPDSEDAWIHAYFI